MRFRSYITLALAATSLAPIMAFSYLQMRDMDRAVERADVMQRESAERIASILRERLKSVEEIARLSESLLANEETKDKRSSTEAVEVVLEKIVLSFPILHNLHLDRRGADGSVTVAGFFPRYTPDRKLAAGQDHRDRWHARTAAVDADAGARGGVRFSPVLLSSQGRPVPLLTFAASSADGREIVSGALELSKLFEGLESHFEFPDASFVVLDPDRQIIFPQSSENSIRRWEGPISGEGSAVSGGETIYATDARLNLGSGNFPDWTVVVSRPQKARVSESVNLQVRTVMFGLLVVLFTIAAGFLTARPLREAVRKLYQELHEGGDENTIRSGPEELREYQAAYRAMQARAEERTVKLAELNRNLETLVEQRSRELTAEELLFRQVFNELEDPVLLVDMDWKLRESNKSNKSNYSNQPNRPNRPHERTLSSELLNKLIERCRRQHEVGGDGAFVARDLIPEDERRFECRIFPFSARRSDLKDGHCILVRDVTSREQLDEMKENLIGIVAHELKTPITTCRLQLEAFERENGASGATEAMREDLDHLMRLVSDWLSVVKIDAGTYAVRPEFVQLTPLAAKARRYVAARHAFRFAADISEDAECLYADRSALVELFVNLFTNACRYAKAGEVPDIRFKARRSGEDVVIEVSDAGIGIDPDKREKIFERFYRIRSDGRNAAGGTGLGLVICRAICRAHGGSIEADESEGRTVFRIRLPQPQFQDEDSI